MFRANTRYDWYIIRKILEEFETTVEGEDTLISKIILSEWQFIPNFMFSEIREKIANAPEGRCEIIQSMSAYEPRKKWISKIKTKEFNYPIVYSIKRNGEITFRWSSIDTKGHFGIPKVIYGGGATGFISDKKGEYGLTQWCSGIVAPPSEHNKIIEYLESNEFKKIKNALSVGKSEINTKILRLFKKSWWNIH
jgi:hypothetical protein